MLIKSAQPWLDLRLNCYFCPVERISDQRFKMLYGQNATDLVWGTKRRFSKLALISMTLLWHEILVFVTSFLFGTVFLDVFLTMYERSRAEAASAGTQRIFRWSIRGGIGIGVLTVILQFLFSK